MNSIPVTERSMDALDRLQQALRDLIEALEASKTLQGPGDRDKGPENEELRIKKEEAPAKIAMEDIRAVLVEKARAGKNDGIQKLLEHFNASCLSDVDPADYAELLEMGKGL